MWEKPPFSKSWKTMGVKCSCCWETGTCCKDGECFLGDHILLTLQKAHWMTCCYSWESWVTPLHFGNHPDLTFWANRGIRWVGRLIGVALSVVFGKLDLCSGKTWVSLNISFRQRWQHSKVVWGKRHSNFRQAFDSQRKTDSNWSILRSPKDFFCVPVRRESWGKLSKMELTSNWGFISTGEHPK
jgi:hypothetical protein